MKTYTLCGSMRFAREMQEIAYSKRLQKEIRYHCNGPFPTIPPAKPPFALQGVVLPPHQKPKDQS